MQEIWGIPDEPMTKDDLSPLKEKTSGHSEQTEEATSKEVGGWAE